MFQVKLCVQYSSVSLINDLKVLDSIQELSWSRSDLLGSTLKAPQKFSASSCTEHLRRAENETLKDPVLLKCFWCDLKPCKEWDKDVSETWRHRHAPSAPRVCLKEVFSVLS